MQYDLAPKEKIHGIILYLADSRFSVYYYYYCNNSSSERMLKTRAVLVRWEDSSSVLFHRHSHTHRHLENPQHTFSSAASSGQSPVPFRAVLLAVEGVGLQAGKPRKGAAKGVRTQVV